MLKLSIYGIFHVWVQVQRFTAVITDDLATGKVDDRLPRILSRFTVVPS